MGILVDHQDTNNEGHQACQAALTPWEEMHGEMADEGMVMTFSAELEGWLSAGF